MQLPDPGCCLLKVYKLEDPHSAVLAALSVAGEQLGKALQLPGMMAVSASWDPDAVSIVCLLTVASGGSLATAQDGESVHPRFLLQPATMECLRYVLVILSVKKVWQLR